MAVTEVPGNGRVAAAQEAAAAQAHDEAGHGANALAWPALVRIAVVAAAALAVWLGLWEPFGRVSVFGILGLAVGGWPIVKEAGEGLAHRRMTMELSMAIAILAAAAIGEFVTALVITLFVLIAEILEAMTVARGRRAIRALVASLPHAVSRRDGDAVRQVPASDLVPGDRLLVAPGGLIPVDGTVLAGHSFVDEQRITGESLPVEKIAGGAVFAGTINQSGALEVRAERLGRDTSYGKIIEAVERAERTRAPVQRLADRLAGYIVYFALAAAAATFILSHDLRATIAVIIVAGACGIAAGTPLAILGGIGRLARLGAIVKGGLYLETLGRVDTVVFDKTGTLTFGRPEVRAIAAEPGIAAQEVLAAAAAAELRSEHPLGQAIIAHARAEGCAVPEPETFAYTPGRGIAARVAGASILVGNRAFMAEQGVALAATPAAGAEIIVARDGVLLGTIMVADTVRPEARRVVATLGAMGIRTVLLTGDAPAVAQDVARELGIGTVAAGLLPEEKVAYVRRLGAARAVVAMVGDGVNDAPALAAAAIGIAMGSGSDVARESADVVLLGNDLGRLVDALALARRTRGVIFQNFFGTVAVDLVGIALAAVGIVGPVLAAFIHVVSELAFILNAARLLPPLGTRDAG
jgi:Cd2+/Zn2+-exporting ATPase/Cu+-exporting ATPase